MLAVALAISGALAYGFSDFLGGLLSRRGALWPTALTACTGARLGTLVLAVTVTGTPAGSDFGWALAAGLGSGAGTAFLYRGPLWARQINTGLLRLRRSLVEA